CSAPGYSGDCSPVPIAVVGSLTFTSITVGGSHSCGLTESGAAYCWGHNDSGQLGDSSMQARSAPVAVAGGHAFVTIAATDGNTCGLLADGTAYCWGGNGTGELGIGTTGPGTRVPVPVATSLRFSSLWRGSG